MLRAEILDLEDQYYALKSRCGDAGGQAGRSTVQSFGGSGGDARYYCPDCGGYFSSDQHGHSNTGEPATQPIIGSGVPSQPNPPFGEDSLESIDLQIETPDQGRVPESPSGSVFRRSPNARPVAQRDSAMRSGGEPSSQVGAESALNAGPSGGLGLVAKALERDASPGFDGVWLSLPIRAENNLQVDGLQRLEVSLMDPELPNGQQRIGYWDWGAAESRKMIRDVDGEPTLRLYVPWQTKPRGLSDLILFVRVHDSQGLTQEDSVFVGMSAAQEARGNEPLLPESRAVGESSARPPAGPNEKSAAGGPRGWKPVR